MQTFRTIRHKLFPSFEPKRYHLQFRHGGLITVMLACAAFVMPSYHQTMPYADSDYFGSPDLPVESSYERIHRFVSGILFYNSAVALWIAICLAAEGILQRSAPVWYELAWISLTVIGETICLGLMASSRPAACDYHFGLDRSIPKNGKFSPENSITSICSNWRGMTGQLAAILGLFVLHLVWHVIIAVRYMRSRPGYFTHPMPDYRWTLSRPLDRLEPQSPPTDVEKAAAKAKALETTSNEYTSRATDSFSFPLTPTNEEYSNFSRLPANQKPVVLTQSTVTKSDTSSIVEADGTSKAQAPFSYASK
ncbi:unnamed protein product [Rhizoctonia solani]|uniref:Uncharacterized protein n=1 Tax=Rhizoctonia solani TaxID=456999 RepID=A0A8H2XWU0_9AGAM|nr:unnamed protein product [Rhizoctonia solani]